MPLLMVKLHDDVDPSGSQDSPGAPANDGAHLVSSLDAGSPGAHTPPQVILPGGSFEPPLGSHVTNAVHDSSNGGTQSGSSLDAGSSRIQTSPQAILPGGSSDLPVDPHSSAQVVQQQPGHPLQTDNEDVLMRQTVLTLRSFLSLLFLPLRVFPSSLRVRAFFAMLRMFKTIVLFRGLLLSYCS